LEDGARVSWAGFAGTLTAVKPEVRLGGCAWASGSLAPRDARSGFGMFFLSSDAGRLVADGGADELVTTVGLVTGWVGTVGPGPCLEAGKEF
jgi:hypothetical protein